MHTDGETSLMHIRLVNDLEVPTFHGNREISLSIDTRGGTCDATASIALGEVAIHVPGRLIFKQRPT